MKILRTLLYILLVLVLVLVLLGFVGPKSYDVSRTVQVDAPAASVFPYIKSLKKQNEWGPWKEQDPEMQVTYSGGEDGTVGYTSKWEGKVAGKGEQRIASIAGNTVETELTFYMPWGESNATGYMHVADATQGSEVTWGVRGENDFLMRIFGVFMNMDKGMGPMFDKGLQNLKNLIEGDLNKEYNGYKISMVDFPSKQYVAARSTVKMGEISQYFSDNSARVAQALTKAGVTANGPLSGLYFTWDETAGTTDMAVAMPVQEAVTIPETEMITVNGGKALMIDYSGKYEEMEKPHLAMDEYLSATGMKSKAPVIEEYITGPHTGSSDPQQWLTKIYYLLDQ